MLCTSAGRPWVVLNQGAFAEKTPRHEVEKMWPEYSLAQRSVAWGCGSGAAWREAEFRHVAVAGWVQARCLRFLRTVAECVCVCKPAEGSWGWGSEVGNQGQEELTRERSLKRDAVNPRRQG